MYATLDDMTTRIEAKELVQVSDQHRTGEVNQSAINAALSDAADAINSYVGKKYQVPVTPAPAILKGFQCDIARYNLWSVKGQMPEIVMERYKAAMKWLLDVSSGRAILEAAGIIATEPEGSIEMAANRRKFTLDSLRYF